MNLSHSILTLHSAIVWGPVENGKEKGPSHLTGPFSINSLTMSYFHTGTRTIIGAKAFHCPVRDGKEWYHLAMVIRLDGEFPCHTT
jgi:hypothetical protein